MLWYLFEKSTNRVVPYFIFCYVEKRERKKWKRGPKKLFGVRTYKPHRTECRHRQLFKTCTEHHMCWGVVRFGWSSSSNFTHVVSFLFVCFYFFTNLISFKKNIFPTTLLSFFPSVFSFIITFHLQISFVNLIK